LRCSYYGKQGSWTEFEDRGQLICLLIFVDVTVYLALRKKVLQGKDNLTAEVPENVKAFKVNLRMSTN